MEPNEKDTWIKEEEIKFYQKKEKKEFKNKIGKQRRNCWWN